MTKEEILIFIQTNPWNDPGYKKKLFDMRPLEIAGIVSQTISRMGTNEKEEYLSLFVTEVKSPESWDSYLEVEKTNYPAKDSYSICCHAKNCMYARECAQHTTAGDFRSEDGMTPDIINIDGHISCNKKEIDKSGGMVYISSYGEIKNYPGRYETGTY